jgi:hypothetical protein
MTPDQLNDRAEINDLINRYREGVRAVPWRCVACMPGGAERRTFDLALARELRPFGGDNPQLTSRIDAIEVDVPGAGRP